MLGSASELLYGTPSCRLPGSGFDLCFESFGGGLVCAFVEVAIDVEDGSC